MENLTNISFSYSVTTLNKIDKAQSSSNVGTKKIEKAYTAQ